MAKSNLPSVDDYKGATVPKPTELPPPPPSGKQSEGYVPRQIDVRMSRSQAEKFKAIQRELEDAGATLKDGSPVNNRRRAVLWMIENYIGV